MRSVILAAVVAFLAFPAMAGAGDSAIGNETPTANQAQDKAKADTVDEAREPEPFKIPAGYLTEKRGKKTVYCRKSMESGTRFSQKKCYSEEQLRAMAAEREQEQASMDQSRKVCANVESCAGN